MDKLLAPDTSSNYFWEFIEGSGATVSGQRSSSTFWYTAGGMAGTLESSHFFELTNPATAVITTGFVSAVTSQASTTGIKNFHAGFMHNVAAAYDSGAFLVTTGTMTGSVSVYAYNE